MDIDTGITITYDDLEFFLLSRIRDWERETKDCNEFVKSLKLHDDVWIPLVELKSKDLQKYVNKIKKDKK